MSQRLVLSGFEQIPTSSFNGLFKSIPTVFTVMKQVVVCRLRKTTAGSILVANPATRTGALILSKTLRKGRCREPGRPSTGLQAWQSIQELCAKLACESVFEGRKKAFYAGNGFADPLERAADNRIYQLSGTDMRT